MYHNPFGFNALVQSLREFLAPNYVVYQGRLATCRFALNPE